MNLIEMKDGTPLLKPEIALQIAEFERVIKDINEKEKAIKTAICAEMEEKGILWIDTEDLRISYVAPCDSKYKYFSEAQYKELFTALFSEHGLEMKFTELDYDTFEGTEKQSNGRMVRLEFSLIDTETGFYETTAITGEIRHQDIQGRESAGL